MKELVEQFVGSTRRLLTQPMDELNRWQRTARYAVGIARYGASELKEDRASQMAAALTYRTIFSLVPVFVLSLLVFNAFGGFESASSDLRTSVYKYLGLTSIQIATDGNTTGNDEEKATEKQAEDAQVKTTADPPATDPEGQTALSPSGLQSTQESQANDTQARIDQLLTDLQNRVASVNFTGISVVGLALLIWAALSLAVSLEKCFNRVYNAPHGRPWHVRITVYWAVITLGPVGLALSFYVTNQLINTAKSLTGIGWAVGLFTPFFSLAATWLLLVLIYRLLPAAKVQLRAALVGSLVAAIMWELSKWGFRFYVERAVSYSALYGSLGLVPLFLLWLYVTWMVVLFGLEISYVVQTVKNTRFLRAHHPDHEADRLFDTTAALRIAQAVAQRFDDGRGATLDQLGRETALPPRVLQRLTAALESAGHLHREQTSDEDADPPYTLSRPAERITLADLLQAARHAVATHPTPSTKLIEAQLHAAEAQALGKQTLRDLIEPSGAKNPASI